MSKTDEQRIQTMIQTWQELSRQIDERGIAPEQLLHDAYTQWAITTPLYYIGEQVYNLSPEYKQNHPDIPWNVVSGLRHRLVHHYEGVNWSIIVDIVFHEMAGFIEQLKKLL